MRAEGAEGRSGQVEDDALRMDVMLKVMGGKQESDVIGFIKSSPEGVKQWFSTFW